MGKKEGGKEEWGSPTHYLRLKVALPILLQYGGAENAGVEKAGAITYGKPSEQKTLKIPGV